MAAAPINPLVRLRMNEHGRPYHWEEKHRPGTAPPPVIHQPFGMPYQGFTQGIILLVSPGEKGPTNPSRSNCDNNLFHPHPFDIPPSRFNEHHQHHPQALQTAQALDPTCPGADSGFRWISHHSAHLCEDIFKATWDRGTPAYCCAQILETGVADAHEFQDFERSVVELVTGENNDVAAVSAYANNTNGRNGFHASLIGPLPLWDADWDDTIRGIVTNRGLNPHVRIFTGDFHTDTAAPAICAAQSNIYPDYQGDY